MKIAGNRHARGFEPADCRRDVCVIHVLARIGIPINRNDSTMPGALSMQFVKIFRVVSQQHPLEGLSELEHFPIRCSIPAKFADGYDVVSIGAQVVELCASLRVFINQDPQAGALASTSTLASFKRCRSSLASDSISALLASQ